MPKENNNYTFLKEPYYRDNLYRYPELEEIIITPSKKPKLRKKSTQK